MTDQTSGYVLRKSIPETGEIWLAGKLASAGTSYTVTFGRQLFQHFWICKNTTDNKKPGILHSPKTGVCAAEIGYALTSSDFTVSLKNGQQLLLQKRPCKGNGNRLIESQTAQRSSCPAKKFWSDTRRPVWWNVAAGLYHKYYLVRENLLCT